MRLLFLCTHNACRSILCEVITRNHAVDRIEVASAGSQPSGRVHPLSLRFLASRAYPVADLRSKGIEDLTGFAPDAVITVVEGLSLALREWLIAGRIDLALLFDPAPAAQLYFETLRRESLVLVAPPGSRRLPPRVTLAALADHPLILPASPNALRHLVDDAVRARGLALDVSVEVDSVHTVLSLVARGVGWSVLPESAMDAATLARGMQMAHIGPPAIRNRLVLAVPRARPATRLLRDSAALLRSIGAQAAGRETPPASAKTRAR